ncbi:hypothetical protein MVES1_003953 [Malassezia vespertilionis]|uniref:Kinetochore protein Sos7 coiled-coil domain-containing protein n=1 Tax=Malassezia vespertilionis TaxID=2020962 RepID=A0A2N1J7V8_9BASI|nr:uncharacterized protein MVES1_003953 [Malassezia vespertilionis]PKI82647.1 hypothetical protein MVES_003506 [Malassezia vespertilionis]WFD08577.1 hypothetical protein MVES1_003953 [Malassezia vespertilionis]
MHARQSSSVGEDVLRDTLDSTRAVLAESVGQEATLRVFALRDTLLEYASTEHTTEDKELQLDWDLYRDVPGALEEEEEQLLDYFRKLKFIYLEQETKLRFLAGLQDDPETGQEPQILSTADVAQREHDCKRVKQQLVDAKQRVRDVRAGIDQLADEMEEPWQALERASAEASDLVSHITDMELELAKIKVAEGVHGTMTTQEAETVADDQILAMQSLDDETTQTMRDVDHAKKELADSLKALERLKVERGAAEKLANDAKLGMGRDRGRDWELERMCAKHAANLESLQEALAIRSITAPSATLLRIEYAQRTPAPKRARTSRLSARPSLGEGEALVLEFDEPGGQLLHFNVRDAQDAVVPLDADVLAFCDAAVQSNNVALLVQRLWQDV